MKLKKQEQELDRDAINFFQFDRPRLLETIELFKNGFIIKVLVKVHNINMISLHLNDVKTEKAYLTKLIAELSGPKVIQFYLRFKLRNCKKKYTGLDHVQNKG